MLDPDIRRLLFDAAEKNDSKTVKYFIEKKGASASEIDDLGRTLVHFFARHGDLNMVKYIVEKCPTLLLEPAKHYLRKVLQLAVKWGHLDVVKYLIERYQKDTISNQKENDLENIIPIAIEYGRLDILKYFFDDKKVNVNRPGKWQSQPPVFMAVEYQHHDIVKYLVEEKKANVTARDWIEENVLYEAVRRDDFTILKYFLDERKINFNTSLPNKRGETLVHLAASLNRMKVLTYLVEQKHVNVSVCENSKNMTALHLGALGNHYAACKYLLEHGANPRTRDSAGEIAANKTEDANLQKLLQPPASAAKTTRNRRNVDGSYSEFKVVPRRTLSAGTVVRFGGETSPPHDDRSIYFSQFVNFLLMGTLIGDARKFDRRIRSADLSPPGEYLRKRMNATAEKAIDALPNFDDA